MVSLPDYTWLPGNNNNMCRHIHQDDTVCRYSSYSMVYPWYAFLASVMSGVQQLSFQESRMFTADLRFTKDQF